KSDVRSFKRDGELKASETGLFVPSFAVSSVKKLSEKKSLATTSNVVVLSSPRPNAITMALLPSRLIFTRYCIADWLWLYRKPYEEDAFQPLGNALGSFPSIGVSTVFGLLAQANLQHRALPYEILL